MSWLVEDTRDRIDEAIEALLQLRKEVTILGISTIYTRATVRDKVTAAVNSSYSLGRTVESASSE